jgi:hypothetical protein
MSPLKTVAGCTGISVMKARKDATDMKVAAPHRERTGRSTSMRG